MEKSLFHQISSTRKNQRKSKKVQLIQSGYYVKDKRTKQFAYSFHAAAESKGFVLGDEVTPGNIHDSQMLVPLVEDVIKIVGKPNAVAGDAAYKTLAISKYL